MNRPLWIAAAIVAAATGCAGATPNCPANPPPPVPTQPEGTAAPGQAPATPEEAAAFVKDVNARLMELYVEAGRAQWVRSTYITEDTQMLSAKANERLMEYESKTIRQVPRFEGLDLPPDVARQLYLFKYSAGLPAPSDSAKRERLAEIDSELAGIYGKGKHCSPKLVGLGSDEKSECLNLDDLSAVLAKKRDYDLLLDVWQGWRKISVEMRPLYAELVSLGNEGAKELGYRDMSDIWKGRYDMPAEAFEKEMSRLYTEVKPLYDELHCYTRKKLREKYGKEKVPEKAPIPAHLLGNMWAQEWTNLYDLVEPFKGAGSPDLEKRLKAKKYDELGMVKLAEGFFTSLGMDPLPESFWKKSLFVRPRDREVECHASAWDVDLSGDLRIKMCIRVNHEDLVTIHHELGHNYYFHYYNHLPPLFQNGANDGFHEGIGDTLALSVTPAYLQKVGLYDAVKTNEKAELNELMQRALEGIAFLPFGKLIDEWRWNVFSGKTPPSGYNAEWWRLRREYQGVAPPVERTENDFDPGAKYHIPSNVPYTRYFIARILQYQFHRALCREAGHEGPLHRCSIYGSKKAGDKMKAMLALGASKPWPDALEAMTGEREMSAKPIIDYYAPLIAWLKEQNAKETCGW